MVEDTTLDDDQLASMSTEDLTKAILNFDNGITSLENKFTSMSTEDIIRETRFLKVRFFFSFDIISVQFCDFFI